MSKENSPPSHIQSVGIENSDTLRTLRFRNIVSSWPDSAQEAVGTLSSMLLEIDVQRRIKKHSEVGDWERRRLIDELRAAKLRTQQIRCVFRFYGLKIPKKG